MNILGAISIWPGVSHGEKVRLVMPSFLSALVFAFLTGVPLLQLEVLISELVTADGFSPSSLQLFII